MIEVSLSARFWINVEWSSSCWLWKGEADRYGTFHYQGRMQKAHRIAWILERGGIPRGQYVLHKCDVKGCVRLGHLWLGTYADNVHDCISKGRFRTRSGELNGNSRLNWDKVKEIRRLCSEGIPKKEIALEYHIHPATVQGIACGRRWKIP